MTTATKTTTEVDRLPVAVKLAEAGVRVFPWDYRDGAKVPLTRNGHNDATTDPEQVARWWAANPSAQVGAVWGGSGIVALDLDCHPGKPNGFDTAAAEGLDLPETLAVATPSGGAHRFYRHDGDELSRLIGVRPGIDRLSGSTGWGGFYGSLEDAERLARLDLPELPAWAAAGRPERDSGTAGADLLTVPEFWGRTTDPRAEFSPSGPFAALVDAAATAGNADMARLLWRWAHHASAGAVGAETALRALQDAWMGRTHATGDPAEEFTHMARSAMTRNGASGALAVDEAEILADLQNEHDGTTEATETTATEPTEAVEARPFGRWQPQELSALLDDLEAGTLALPKPELVKVPGSDGEPVGLLYDGKVNGLAGEPGSGKTFIAHMAGIELMRAGRVYVFVDYEDSAAVALARLRMLGADVALLRERFRYVEGQPVKSPKDAEPLLSLVASLADPFVALDSVGEALGASGWTQNDDGEVARWGNMLVHALARHGATVLMLDHMAKGADGQLWPIGSQRKLALVTGAQYIAQVVQPFSEEEDGCVVLKVSKDRHGARAKQSAASFVQFSHPVEPTLGADGELAEEGTRSDRLRIRFGPGKTAAEMQKSKQAKQDRKLSADVDALDALTEPPKSKAEVMRRMRWGDTRALDALRVWRANHGLDHNGKPIPGAAADVAPGEPATDRAGV